VVYNFSIIFATYFSKQIEMNSRQIITLVVVAIAGLAIGYFIGSGMGGVKSEGQVTMNDNTDSLNYFLGLNMAYSLTDVPWELDGDLIISGMHQVLNDTSSFDPMTAQNIFGELTMAVSQQQEAEQQMAAQDNLSEGNDFLEENGKREGVITTESGLQYEVITEGTGPKPNENSTVTVFYEGTLIDGTVFDSSYETGDSVTFPLNGVIPGWTEGLQLMSVGSTYNLYLPASLGYGARATGPIPGNSVLIFKVELLDIEE
jgi:FKBP-type peptidyl-prolyl cis-trans isomerase